MTLMRTRLERAEEEGHGAVEECQHQPPRGQRAGGSQQLSPYRHQETGVPMAGRARACDG